MPGINFYLNINNLRNSNLVSSLIVKFTKISANINSARTSILILQSATQIQHHRCDIYFRFSILINLRLTFQQQVLH